MKLWFEDVVTVVSPVVWSYSKLETLNVGTDKSNLNSDEFASAAAVTIPVYFLGPTPSETKPKLPNEEFEFVKSHWPPDPVNIDISGLIVNIETNCP